MFKSNQKITTYMEQGIFKPQQQNVTFMAQGMFDKMIQLKLEGVMQEMLTDTINLLVYIKVASTTCSINNFPYW